MTTTFEDRVSAASADELQFLLMSPEGRADPYSLYRRLREERPVLDSKLGTWILTRHRDVAMIRDARFVQGAAPIPAEMRERPLTSFDSIAVGMMLANDPPDHTRLRSLVTSAFTPRAVESLRSRVREIVDGLLDAIPRDADLIADFAYPLPVTVICELLGIPAEDRSMYREWSKAIVPAFDGTADQVGIEAIDTAACEIVEHLVPLVDERRRHPRADLMSALVAAEEQGDKLTSNELIANVVLLFFAGHETTVNLIGNGTLALMRHRDQWDRLREKPELVRGAVEELLRYDSPVQGISRRAITDVEIDGHTVPHGDQVTFLFGAANRDPEVFADPDRLDVTRKDVHHLSFGAGIHFCVGAPLARLEGQVAFEALTQRLPYLRLAVDEPEWRAGLVLRGLKALPVTTG